MLEMGPDRKAVLKEEVNKNDVRIRPRYRGQHKVGGGARDVGSTKREKWGHQHLGILYGAKNYAQEL